MRHTSWVGELGMSAPAHKPFTAISRNLAPGVLEYSRFQESSTMVLFGSSSSGFFALGSGLGSAGSSSSAAAAAAAAYRTGLTGLRTCFGFQMPSNNLLSCLADSLAFAQK